MASCIHAGSRIRIRRLTTRGREARIVAGTLHRAHRLTSSHAHAPVVRGTHALRRLRHLRRHARPEARRQRGARARRARCWSRASPAPARRCSPRRSRARSAGRCYQWHVKSTTKAQQGLYEYDAVSRLRDSQLGDGRVGDIANYIKPGVLWDAFDSETPAVVLIDEIDKADIEFPNDLLRELDRMEFHVYETQQTIVRAAPAARRHHVEQRKGAARRVPAPLLLPLHPLPRPRDDDADRRRSFPGSQEGAAAGGARSVLRRCATCRG